MANSLAQYLADLQVQIKEAESQLVFGVVISTSPLRVKYGEITLEDNFLFVEDGLKLTVGQKVPMLKTNRSQLFIVMLSNEMTPQDILSAIKTVDGSGSGLDADLLDGKHASDFSLDGHAQAWSTITDTPTTATRWPTWTEVTSKPTTFTPATHNQAWSTITSIPATATRWPTWSEVTGGNTSIGNAGSARKKYSWGGFYSASSSNTGVIRIHVGTSNTMFNAKISLRSYSYLADISVGGYTYTSTGNWHMPQATGRVVGGTLNVRFSGSGANRYIQIGDTNTAWSGYLHVTIDDVSVGYTPDFPSPFTVSLATSYIGTTGSTQKIGELYHTGNMPTTATRWPTWSEVTGKPSTFAPSTHSHAWSAITSKPSTFSPSSHTHTTGSKSSSGYVKFDNGIKINWVKVTVSANTRSKSFTWPSAFASTPYGSWASSIYHDMIVAVDPVSATGGAVEVGVPSNGNGVTQVNVVCTAFAIGV